MSKLKNTPIDYTSRDYDSIKNDLINHAKRYYSEEWKDFSKSTINSFLVDSVSYIGDVLSYYLDYQVNESFLETSIEFANIRKHARALGYKFAGSASSYGTIAMFCLVPSNSDGTAPDYSYMPTIQRGTSFNSSNGGTFILTEDVRFDEPNNEIVAARFNDTTGETTHFAVKAYGQIVSGIHQRIVSDLSNSSFEKFRKVRVGGIDITEIISVKDSDGNEYYEVDNLAQEVVFKETTNQNALNDGVRSIMKPFVAARRFTFEQDDTGTFLQFGFGSETNESDGLVDPAQVALKMHGKRSISDLSFDPSKLLGTTKLGIAPSNTKLIVIAKSNNADNVNAGVNTITELQTRKIKFDDLQSLNGSQVSEVINSIEVTNEEPIVGSTEEITNEELKVRAKTFYSSQNRAVTKQDYESAIYNMPKKFGLIKRVNVVNDPSATNRRIAMYLISENSDGKLVASNSKIKSNVKNWIKNYKGLNDVIDIYDARIVNFGIDFKIVVDERFKQFDIIGRCVNTLTDYFSNQLYIGEPIYLTRLYSVLGKIDGVADVKKVSIYKKNGGRYSNTLFDFDEAMSMDGTFLKTPQNVVMELKFPKLDIKGTLIR
tara:strand:+ start:17839 stop:19641 length:1803 start_codon:yes stop_codon:yes gene_type:complete